MEYQNATLESQKGLMENINASIKENINAAKDLDDALETDPQAVIKSDNVSSSKTDTGINTDVYSKAVDAWKNTSSQKLAIAKNELKELNSLRDQNLIGEETYAARVIELQNEISANSTTKLSEFFSKFGAGIRQGFDVAFQALELWDQTLEASKANELAMAGDNEERRSAIEKKYAQKRKKMMLVQAVASGALAVIGALTTQPIWVGIIMAAITAAMVGVQIAKINAASFATGGVVGGTSFSGDKVQARVNSGEMILNSSQQARLFEMANGGASRGGEVIFRVDGTQLVGVLNNFSRTTNKIR